MDTETVKVLSITEKTPTQWDVLMSIGQKQYHFIFSVEQEQDEPNLLSIKESQQFSQLFQYNIHISSKVLSVLTKMIQGIKIEFTQVINNFLTSEQALAQQQEFNSLFIN